MKLRDTKRFISGSLTGYEMYALGYTISMCGRSWNLTLPWTTASGFQMLVHGLKHNQSSTGSISVLDLYSSKGILTYLPQLPRFILWKLEDLSLARLNLIKEDFQSLALFISQSPSLKALTISVNPGGPGSLVDLMQALKTQGRIEYLAMDYLDIGMEDVAALSDLIKSSNSSLKWLRVGSGKFSQNNNCDFANQIYTQQELVKTVLSPSSLVNVEIVPQSTFEYIMKSHFHKRMEALLLTDVISNRLESLTFRDNSLQLEFSKHFFNLILLRHLLIQNNSLKRLTLFLKLSQQDIENLVLWLEENNSLETLQLLEEHKESLSNKILTLKLYLTVVCHCINSHTGRKSKFPANPDRAQFPVHFPTPVLQKCRNGTGH